ncbi:HNH endonuclease [Bacteroides phage PhiCrAssBcn17]|jgi:DNA-binding transcriptional regulator YiaG|uniref:HNH endonuclease n=1 Tax=Bacteroides phage crAss001 TaxID=2301731 RepID=A0A385DVU5_BPCA1|nr:HNH endonuclease [Bacteroides phage crAss001]WCF56956.1 HNH endonuclease [Bacteroides phage PhiCrAssBcn9]WCF57127.1 HNH endonuclease [Bacteroides phage PhiCrAssBcn13]WCF58171.1 HNH endonuclease [Bacteroides phage PhiCrAssBcn10]WCF58178.1 HNH endonuclease [Bacteroides phage PhiCrAssBcn11]WCF58282.1 HNH endonuclease [Bacteroides phage PhiCrAssBcn12]WCF58679.1 HNH endonuclease [Bacteroides phage PhiCrAssBcn17]WCS67233.1 hypothetical protein PhiCrAssBcn20_59 [Bacteroides phage PhiCrAssBcn20]
MEELKSIGNNYSVSIDGRVYSHKRNKYLQQRVGPRGYMMVNLSIGGKCKTFTVHRLVATAWIPNPNNKEQINHIDGDKTNNSVNNLEWCTSSQNVIHAFDTGLKIPSKGLVTKNGRFNDEDIAEIRRLYNEEHLSQYKIASIYNVTRSAIQQILNNSTYKGV